LTLPSTLTTLINLGGMYGQAGNTTKAIAVLEQVRPALVKAYGPKHPHLLSTLNNLAYAYWLEKRLNRSIPLFEQVVVLREEIQGDKHPETINARANLGVNYCDAGRPEDAIPLLEKAHQQGRKYASLRFFVSGALLTAYVRAGRTAEGSALARANLEEARKALPADSPQLATGLATTGSALLDLKAWADAETALRACLAIREKKEPAAWTTFNTRSLLGAALLGQKKYPEAEPHLLQGYEGLKREAKMTPLNKQVRSREALERLVRLYDGWGRPKEAAKWRKELQARTKAAEKVAPATAK
jgi:tetratricopeptide (TPR) repeat protein